MAKVLIGIKTLDASCTAVLGMGQWRRWPPQYEAGFAARLAFKPSLGPSVTSRPWRAVLSGFNSVTCGGNA
jgi:hypothetical protein